MTDTTPVDVSGETALLNTVRDVIYSSSTSMERARVIIAAVRAHDRSSPPGGVDGELLAAFKAIMQEVDRPDYTYAPFVRARAAIAKAEATPSTEIDERLPTYERVKEAFPEVFAQTAAQGEREAVSEELLVDMKEAAKLLREGGHQYYGGRCEDAAALLRLPAMVPVIWQRVTPEGAVLRYDHDPLLPDAYPLYRIQQSGGE